ncbi:WD40 repeat domain-containing protein [Campylobacter canadensis]|uniref:Nitrate reductase accessory protein n=1 Tax=Campylobacter canadensis TaxID=449520 RepID=A0ABS7WRK4_9BACT|nr:hypothetical protein [Campylobacter canadensis]MBZ7986962.1 hypothetical protein [Campylobacter canadensis]MBZ7994281.1 hypothetical protein [Campylobacter canadensis]MBZ7995727.1 hypothetical protein [Campylobacter canadensis]MBZ7997998.1 hypothetical protein [Campylobacter canadensis]MBZ7999613.1 hypothetical protein [Campylobacter canadensis]
MKVYKLFFILLANVLFASELSLDKLQYLQLPCNLNAISDDYLACDNGYVLDKNANIIKDLKEKIVFIDNFEDNLLILTQANDYKKLYLNDKVVKLSNAINYAYLGKNEIYLSSLASELFIFDFSLKELFKLHFSNASIGAMAINENRNKLVLGLESGALILFDTLDKSYKIKEVHKDNIYSLSFKKHRILSSSTDRKVLLSDENLNEISSLTSDNLIYFCVLTDKSFAYSCDVENNICIDDIKINIGNLYLNSLYFYDNKLYLNSYSNKLYYKEIK